jgi:hypothetical protein
VVESRLQAYCVNTFIPGVFGAKVACNTGNLIFSWNDDIPLYNGSENDKVIMVAYCEDLNQCIYSTTNWFQTKGRFCDKQ